MPGRPFLLPFCAIAFAGALFAQTPAIEGSWEGALKTPTGMSLRLRIHIAANPDGTLKGTMDSVDQGAFGTPIDSVTYREGVLRWTIERVRATYEGRFAAGGGELTGTFTQGVAMELNLKRMSAAAAKGPLRPQEPKPPFPYRVTEVTFPSKAEGVQLAGTLTIPADKPGARPAVALVSGSGPQDRDETIMGHKPFWVLADALSRAGIAVLRYDDRGVGKSTGDFSSSTSTDFSDDAEAALEFLRIQPGIDPKSIGLIGHSEGGMIAPMVAARRDDVAFLILLAGTAVPGADVMLAQGEAIGKAMGAPEPALVQQRQMQQSLFDAVRTTPDPEALRQKVEQALAMLPEAQRAAQVRQITGPWMRFFITYDPAPVLRRVRCPVLALFGGKDLQVLASQNAPVLEQALRAGGNERVEVAVLEGLNHLFQPARTGSPQEYGSIETTIDEKALAKILGWIKAEVRP